MQINTETKVLAVIGSPIAHSLSPVMHNAALQQLGLNFVYLAFDVKHLKSAIGAMRDLGFRGYSVTVPHKEKILAYLDRIDPVALKIGAVNTVVNNNGLLVGYNTDAGAAVSALLEKTSLGGKRVLIVGAGGVGRAIAFALQQHNVHLTICDRLLLKARSLAKAVGCDYVPLEKLKTTNFDILVNATPVGMFPKTRETPVAKNLLRSGLVVFDVVYNPRETLLLRNARDAGCVTVSGVEMFVEQGARQFELFTGQKAPKETMKKIVLEALSK